MGCMGCSVGAEVDPAGVGYSGDCAPEVGHDGSVVEEDAAGFAEGDLHVLGEEVFGLRVAKGGLGARVEDDDLVLDIEGLEILGEGDVDALGLVAEVVDGGDAAVGEWYGGADLSAQVGGARVRPRSALVVGDGPVVVQVVGGAVDVGPNEGVDAAVGEDGAHLVPPEGFACEVSSATTVYSPQDSPWSDENRAAPFWSGMPT